MSVISLRDSLKKIGEPQPGKLIPNLLNGFYSAPRSLKAAMNAMNSPQMDKWVQSHEDKITGKRWTEDCQGITSDGISWFVVSNNDEAKALYKFSINFDSHISTPPGGTGWIPPVGVDFNKLMPMNLHIGAPDYFEGKIYVPVEPSSAVWVTDTNLMTLDIQPLGGSIGSAPQGQSMPWCAINPWNGYLYSSTFDNVDRIYAYDPANHFAHVEKKDILLQGGTVNKINGGCFSQNGHLYLASNDTQYITGYSTLNGAFLGYHWVEYDKDWDVAQEIEGISITRLDYPTGDPTTYVNVLVLENNIGADDIFFKHFSVPATSVL